MVARIGSLFSGVGGLEIGLERAFHGVTMWQVERNPFCRSVLAKHWPLAKRFEDVKTVGRSTLSPVDLVCGGFPCQPFSVAGKRRAQADERHLWPEYARLIDELAPKIVVAENVPGLRTSGLRDVLADLTSLGFGVEWCCFGAGDIGAPHVRKRIWIVATHPHRVDVREQPGWLSRACESAMQAVDRCVPPNADVQHIAGEVRDWKLEAGGISSYADRMRRLESAISLAAERGWAEHCGWTLDPASLVDDGFPRRLVRGAVGEQRKALGNAVVVRCAEVVGRAIAGAVSGDVFTGALAREETRGTR